MKRYSDAEISHAIRAISSVLGAYAVPTDKIPHLNENNVRVMGARKGHASKKNHLLFHFETRDGFDLKIDVDLAEFMADPLEYIDGMMEEIVKGMNVAREKRQNENRIWVPGPEGLVVH